jgi:uncharacterized protein YjbI with pentapeptide repeats
MHRFTLILLLAFLAAPRLAAGNELCPLLQQPLMGVRLFDQDWKDCRLSRARWMLMEFSGISAQGTVFDLQNLRSVFFMAFKAPDSVWTGAQIIQTDFQNANLERAQFRGSHMRHVSFVGANLKGASFKGSMLQRVNFSGAILEGVDFTDAICVNCIWGSNANSPALGKLIRIGK